MPAALRTVHQFLLSSTTVNCVCAEVEGKERKGKARKVRKVRKKERRKDEQLNGCKKMLTISPAVIVSCFGVVAVNEYTALIVCKTIKNTTLKFTFLHYLLVS